MSTTLHVVCDRCRQPVVEDRHVIRFDSGSLRERKPDIDTCLACAAALLEWLDQGVAAPAEAAK
jgi:hypothetical protein